MINTTKTKTLLVTAMIPVALLAGGCKAGSIPANSPAAVTEDSSIGTTTTDLQPAPVDSPADAAPVDSTCPATNTTAFAKTKFVAHAGLAFGAFHQWIWKPMTAKPTAFGKGQPGRVTAFVKAGAAALFVKREVRLAAQDAKASPALCKVLAAPLAAVGNKVQDAYARLRSGDTSGVSALQSSISSIESQAARAGDTITERTDVDPNSPAN